MKEPPYRFTSQRGARPAARRADPLAMIANEINGLLSALDRADVRAKTLVWREALVSSAALRPLFVRHRGHLQARSREEWVGFDFAGVERFAAGYAAGAPMNPILVLDVGGTLLVPDSLHRAAGAIVAGVPEIAAYVAVLPYPTA